MITQIWETFLTILREEAGSRVVETWFKAVVLDRWEPREQTVYLRAPNAFVRQWISSNYMHLFQLHLGRLLNVESPKIMFIDASQPVQQPPKTVEPLFAEPIDSKGTELAVAQSGKTILASKAARSTQLKNRSHINPNYTFETFVVGPNNSLAYAAAHAIAQTPGQLYSPLFIYGHSGLGKTHLLHAVGNAIKNKTPNATVLYQPTDRFINEFINAIRFNKVPQFQAKYRAVDVLLIDDVQFIAHKEQTQEAFFHIFNILHEAQKQIVFTSDAFPHEIEGLAERLRSRLSWGLVVDIYEPSFETKMAILQKKAEQYDEPLSSEVAEFIASRMFMNIRELEGALVRVMAFASLTKQPLSVALAQKVLVRPQQEVQHAKSVCIERIARTVCKHYPYKLDDLKAKDRGKDLTIARQIAMYFMKQMTDKSLREIGEFFGGRDHSTVMHAVEKIENYAQNSDFQMKLDRIKREINS